MKQALSHEILMTVDKPARYIGQEINMVRKDPESVDIRFAMCFPDVYEIGMSHLGLRILYDMFNRRSDTYCERVFSPWPDLHKIMKERNIPLFALETQDPVKDFDFLGFTLQYEMSYTNCLQVLDLSGIPLLSKDRSETDPIVIGGGPCTYNAEPLADIFDMFYIGEGETRYDELLDLYKEHRRNHTSRADFLRSASHIDGIYVPSLYRVTYNPDQTVASIDPLYEDVPARVRKQAVRDINAVPYPTKPLVPFLRPTNDRVTLEIQRGCIRGCRFCQAGSVYRPVRERDVNELKEYARDIIEATGYDEITLSSLSSSDYGSLKELTYYLIDEFGKKYVNISLPSLRIDSFSLDVMSKVQDIKKSSLTFAPEAGTQHMRNVINKGLTREDILGGALKAFRGGWNKVKLYFMVGLPFETDEDVKGIPKLAEEIAEEYYEIPVTERQKRVTVTSSASFFVPKPFTAFQWSRMNSADEFLRKAYLARDTMMGMKNKKSLRFQYHDAETTMIEGILARGDRRLGQALVNIYRAGCFFDAWTEYFHPEIWYEEMKKLGLDPDFYTARERDTDEVLPWDVIDAGVSKSFLEREYMRAREGTVTPNCMQHCSGCGAASFGTGICYYKRNAEGEVIREVDRQ